jgi:hypothetical protein
VPLDDESVERIGVAFLAGARRAFSLPISAADG